MKAIITENPGGVENLKLQDLEIPQPADNEVLVKVYAISINPVDIKTRKGGTFHKMLNETPPVILGWDISGVVTAIGANVTAWKEGDEVFGMVNFPGKGKAYAEYVVAPADHLARKPQNISHAQAAATTLAALTAYQVMVHEANLQKGQHLLMHAAAGGVGHFAVQLAKHLGVTVSGTASAGNASFLKELGVDNFIDYKSQSLEEAVQDVDLVFDTVGGDTTAASVNVVKKGGNLISIVGGVKENLTSQINEKGITAKNYLVHSSGADMEVLANLLEQRILKPVIEHTFPLEEMAKAHEQIETGRTRGKVVLTVAE
ncbi:NADP-dependent oxidoreductase [Adhaeribacter radiodurans]|uniref:NADP-dependent oxidoreductase n=1 Tax=Adhaeribacter radiodurans TaxID=2745197 RepID=A0A7L7L403_9BACT|nr:NADP-dependent oxidoreductase [Adhaeribacter radiodurans]QMU27503.1 NADP-dependent oxidoreductase [Adhaeribacter radiodurans]